MSEPVRKVAHALAPGELAALAQQDGAPAGITDDEAYEWYQNQPPQTIDLVMAALTEQQVAQLREDFEHAIRTEQPKILAQPEQP